MDESKCKSCGAAIVWVKTMAGKAMPLDPKELLVVTELGTTVKGRTSHFATCPDAELHRKRAP